MEFKKPRPSTLPHLEWCPRYVSRPDRTEDEKKDEMDLAAEEGTFLHARMEDLAALPETEWNTHLESSGLSPAHVDLLRECAEQVRDLFKMGLKVRVKNKPGMSPLLTDGHYMLSDMGPVEDGVYAECSLDPGVARPGTADLVAVMGSNAVLVDYKFTMVERDHDAQMLAYVLGLFEACPRVQVIENRIVAPRLRDVHKPHIYRREKDYVQIKSTLEGIVDAAADPFTPGNPGAPCATCAGNGRCPWQMASLRDVPVDESGLMLPSSWKPVLAAETPETRALRRRLYSWLTKWMDAVKEDDKQWASEHPDADLPGFKRTSRLGRLSLDKDRSPEICTTFMEEFNVNLNQMTELLDLNTGRATEFISLHTGVSQDAAKDRLCALLMPYMSRGADIVYFTPVRESNKLTGRKNE